jgi:DNA helicase HerA-like ATPase
LDQTNIRVKEHCGLVTNDTGTDQFSFLISPLKNRAAVEKESYIAIDHPVYGDAFPVLAVVKEIKSYEEVAGSTLGDRIGKMLATAEVVGFVDARENDRQLRKLLIPPNPGSRVFMPYAEFVEDTYGRDPKGKTFRPALHIGKIDAYATATNNEIKQIRFFLDPKELMNGHSLIAAIGGAGKTHTATILVEELANKTEHPTVILDPYGEYGGIYTPIPGTPAAAEYPFSFNVSVLTANPPAADKSAEENPDSPHQLSVKVLPRQWAAQPNEKTEREIKSALEESIKANRVTIVNAAGLSIQDRKALFESCLKALLKSRLEAKTEPVFVVIEDAEDLKRELLEEIAHEGRKTGIRLCLLSTHPSELGGKVLSHMATQFLGKTTDRDDIEYLKNMARDAAALLPQLMVGELIINRIRTKQPMQVAVRKRYT